jgi:hypothetical protein
MVPRGLIGGYRRNILSEDELGYSSQTLRCTYQTTWCRNPEQRFSSAATSHLSSVCITKKFYWKPPSGLETNFLRVVCKFTIFTRLLWVFSTWLPPLKESIHVRVRLGSGSNEPSSSVCGSQSWESAHAFVVKLIRARLPSQARRAGLASQTRRVWAPLPSFLEEPQQIVERKSPPVRFGGTSCEHVVTCSSDLRRGLDWWIDLWTTYRS